MINKNAYVDAAYEIIIALGLPREQQNERSALCLLALLNLTQVRHGLKRKTRLVETTAGLVYVTAFPSRAILGRYLSEISWKTEVWIADAPSHLIHFDGERFLGPYNAQ